MTIQQVTPTNFGTATGGPVGTVDNSSLPGTFIVQKADGSTNELPNTQICASTADAVLFNSATNIAVFTSTGPDAATLATPGASDVGKILILVNDNTTQNVVTTAANKIRNGAAAGHILTAPATAGATLMLVASNGFWNTPVNGTGTWVLS